MSKIKLCLKDYILESTDANKVTSFFLMEKWGSLVRDMEIASILKKSNFYKQPGANSQKILFAPGCK